MYAVFYPFLSKSTIFFYKSQIQLPPGVQYCLIKLAYIVRNNEQVGLILHMKPRLSRSLQRFIAGVVVACAYTVQADDLTWNGETGANVWNTEATNTPWQNTTPEAAPFVAGDNVTFATPTGNVTNTVQVGEALQAGTVSVESEYVFETTAESSIAADFAGAGTMTKRGEFDLTLESAGSTTAGPELELAQGNMALAGTASFNGVRSMAEGTELTVAEGADITFRDSVNGTDVALQGKMNLQSGDSVLNSVNGSGSLNVADAATLALAENSFVGTFENAGSVTAAQDLLIEENVTTGGTVNAKRLILNNGGTFTSLKTDNLVLGSELNQAAPVVTAENIAASTADAMDIDVTRVTRASGDYTLVSSADMGTTTYTLTQDTTDRFLKDGFIVTLSQEQEGLVLSLDTTNSGYYERQVRTANGKAGADLLDEAFGELDPQANAERYPALSGVLNAMDAYIAEGNGRAADALAASVAGAGIANLNIAWRGQMERQLRSIRNRVSTLNGGVGCPTAAPVAYDPKSGMPAYSATPATQYTFWANAEIDHTKLDGGSAPGYSLNSIGGTAGMAMNVNEDLTVGAAFTGMHGRLGIKGYGSDASGDLDAYYGTVFARMDSGCWTHSLIGSVGFADISLNRRVYFPGGSYGTHGSADGLSFGVMYEVARSFKLNSDTFAEAWWQPVFNVSYIHSQVDSYTESGSDAALSVGKQESNNVIFGLGARMQGIVGQNWLNTPAIMEARVLGKAIAGRTEGSASVSIPGLGNSASVHGADPGNFGVELGVGFSIPLGKDCGSLLLDCSAEFYSDQTSVNGILGYQCTF